MNPVVDTVSSEKYWLHIKNQIEAKMRRCLRLVPKVEKIKKHIFFSKKSVSKPINAWRRDERELIKKTTACRKEGVIKQQPLFKQSEWPRVEEQTATLSLQGKTLK